MEAEKEPFKEDRPFSGSMFAWQSVDPNYGPLAFQGSLKASVRGPRHHINMRILVPRPNTRGKAETMVCRILTLIFYYIPYHYI